MVLIDMMLLVKVKNNNQQTIILKRIQIIVLNVIKHKTPSSFKVHNTKFHKVKKDQKVKEASLKDNVGKGKLDTIVEQNPNIIIGQSPIFTKKSNTIIPNIQSGINNSLYINPPLQNLLTNLSTKLTDKLLNKERTITLGRGIDHNKNDPNYSDLNLSTEEFVKSRLS